MAPSGFLLGLKAVVAIAGANEYTLRLIPLLSSLLALPLFAALSRRYLSRPAMLLALGAFAACPPLIRHAAQVKPYSSDVAICVLCLLAAHWWMAAQSPRNAARLALAGALGMWFSYPVMFVLATIGVVALVRCGTRFSPARIRQTGAVVATWCLSFGAVAALERLRYSPATHSFMTAFWADWLMPHDRNLHSVSAYLARIVRDCLSDFLRLPKWPVFLALLVAGSIWLVRRNGNAALIIGPVLLTLAASMLGVYPFSGRLILFLVPVLMILIAAGFEAAISYTLGYPPFRKERIPAWAEAAVWAGATLILCVWPLRNVHPPYRDSETKPMIAYLGAHRRAGDGIYVHDMAWLQFVFYGPWFGLRTDEATAMTPTPISSSAALGPKPLVILKDLDSFRGQSRVWILFGGGYPVEASCAVWYLDSIGTQLDHQKAFNASLYLYDLSGAGRQLPVAEVWFAGSRSAPACNSDKTRAVGPQQ
ncbi:MAG: hypothetical protein WA294_14880 [Acidobacteriaceae bacterium]